MHHPAKHYSQNAAYLFSPKRYTRMPGIHSYQKRIYQAPRQS